MSKRHDSPDRDPQREQTDESLRVERDKADASVAEKRLALEAEADGVVRLARERADQIIEAARASQPVPPAEAEAAERERAVADAVLGRERSTADATLGREREAHRRYLADFLKAEREATDAHLSGERAHADDQVAARDEFLAMVSHDLRALLGGLALSAALVARHAPPGPEGDPLRRQSERSERLVARMNRLVNDLLDVASIEARKLALFPDQVEVSRLLRDTLDAFDPLAAERGIALESDSSALTIPAWIDDGRILQVLANLVSNALKFTPAGGRISLRIRSEGEEIHVSVSDTGVGIPAEALPRVFDRFRQVYKDPRGLGIGLHISKSIVEAHGGRMWVESAVGEGSTFHFVVPAGRDGWVNAEGPSPKWRPG